MSGLLALLDDVAALARVAATQLDDVAAATAKASSKAAALVIDDGAVTPKYVHGLPAAREIPIVLQIGRGSLFNKIVVLLPAALILSAFLPWILSPLLMLGGAYLSFEGAEKIWHAIAHRGHRKAKPKSLDAAHLEEQRVKGAIKTDFILSAEIMAITLSTVEAESIWMQGIVLLLVAIGITFLVYGVVALLVKADDFGLRLSQTAETPFVRKMGRAIVRGMPKFMSALAIVGTGAMLWVGGSIILHGLDELGFGGPYHWVHDVAVAVAAAAPAAKGFVEWFVTATFDGILGLLLGLALIPVGTRVVGPLVSRLTGGGEETPAAGATH